jgi:hypothetical protein
MTLLPGSDVIFEEERPWPWAADAGVHLQKQFTVI